MQIQYSFRVIIFYKKRTGRDYLLLRDIHEQWTFPKGLITKNTAIINNIKQKITENTGLGNLEFIAGFKETRQLTLTFEAELIRKIITWYLVKTTSKKVKMSKYYQEYKWCTLRKALSFIKIKYNQEFLKKADEFLDIPRLI